jgi:RND family efflux transporter MFP subunit
MEPHLADSKDPAAAQAVRDSQTQAPPPFKFRPIVVIVAVSALIIAIVAGALPKFFQEQTLISKKKQQLLAPPSVSYVVATPAPPLEEFVLPGSTQAIVDAPIYARVNGYLSERYANIGDVVHAGQVLADIDTPELDKQVQAAEDNVRQAKANLDTAKEALSKAESDARAASANVQKSKTDMAFTDVEYKRYQLLSKQGAVSMEDRDNRLTAYNGAAATLQALLMQEKSAQASVRSATAAVRVAKAAMESAQSQHDQQAATQSFKKVRAQFDGVVVARNVDKGALITSGSNTDNTQLFEVAKTDVLRIFAYVPEQFVSFVHMGQEATLTFQAFPDKQFKGTVAYIAGGLDPASRTLQVEIHVANPDHNLMPGMYVQVHFQAKTDMHQPVVPASAIQTRADGTYVCAIDNENRVHRTTVTIGRDLGGKLEISKGLAVGDRVIISPSDDIIDGVLINPVPVPTTK